MITAGEFRKGVTFEMEGNIYVVVDFQHVKPGKGSAFVRTTLKNIVTGQTLEKTFNPTEKFEAAHIDKKDMQYLYNQDGIYYFMDMETYEQLPLNKDSVGDALNYLTENMMAYIQSYKGKPFSVEAPMFVDLKITQCEPAVAGDTAKNAMKSATVETGYKLMVPLFVGEGETIRIDTRTGTYLERVK
jgi:elongation factor P